MISEIDEIPVMKPINHFETQRAPGSYTRFRVVQRIRVPSQTGHPEMRRPHSPKINQVHMRKNYDFKTEEDESANPRALNLEQASKSQFYLHCRCCFLLLGFESKINIYINR